MQFANRVAHCREFLCRRLDEQQPFPARFHLSLPAVNRFNVWDDIHASGQLPLDQMMGDLARLFFGTRGGEDDLFVGHIKSHVGLSERNAPRGSTADPTRSEDSFMLTQIKFGTSGWRAVMAEEFTFANVRRAVGGIARYVASQKSQGARVIVGRDPRFLGETFCSMAAEILAAKGITPLVVADPAPTPAFAHAVTHNKADGVINFTAVHNPPEYNGIKFSTPDGCPALPEVTKKIEAEIIAGDGTAPAETAAVAASGVGSVAREGLDPKPGYLKR